MVEVIEVKKNDFVKEIVQYVIQFESSLSNHKCKTDKIKENQIFERVFGIVIDAEKFYFMECSLDNYDRPYFKLLKLVIIIYNNEYIKIMVEKVLDHII